MYHATIDALDGTVYAAVVTEMPALARVRTAEELYGYGLAFTEYEAFEAAWTTAGGLSIGQCIELGGEWRERDEEDGGGRTCRQLPHVSRLLRPAYQERFGADAYEAMLGNCLWGVYQMIGKLNPRVYLRRR